MLTTSKHVDGGQKERPFLVIALVGLLVYAALYLHDDPIKWGKQSFKVDWLAKEDHQPPEDPKLMQLAHLLKNAAMENNTVILVTLNEAWAKPNSILDLFLESFQIGELQSLIKHLIFIATDEKAMNRCKEMQLHCYLLTIDGVDLSGSEKRFMTNEYLALIWERLHFFGKVLELGYNFITTDVDVLWFRTPFSHFTPNDDITISCDRFKGRAYDLSNKANAGFIFVKSNNRTINFYNHWYQMRSQYPKKLEQDVFNIIIKSNFVKNLKLKIRFLDTKVFGGFCEHGKDLNKLCTLHATCCVGLDRKLHDLKMVLDVWRNFSSLPEEKKLKGIPWRVPIKCRM